MRSYVNQERGALLSFYGKVPKARLKAAAQNSVLSYQGFWALQAAEKL
jgi:hypothetical protein